MLGQFKTEADGHGGLIITGYTGSGGAVSIPPLIDHLRVTGIGDKAFYESTTLTSVTIPSSVTSIGEEAFVACEKLTDVKIPASVTSIGDDAFASCESLIGVDLPNSLTGLGIGAFYNGSDLATVKLSNRLSCSGECAGDNVITSRSTVYRQKQVASVMHSL